MHERSFILLIGKEFNHEIQQRALLAARELFSVEIKFDAVDFDLSFDAQFDENCRWVVAKGSHISKLDNAKV